MPTDIPTDSELDAIDQRCAAATPGPWMYDEPTNWAGLSARVRNEKLESVVVISLSGWGKRIGRRIGLHIARARTDLPRLVAAVRELKRRLAKYEPTERTDDED